jgi:hypothetical protein
MDDELWNFDLFECIFTRISQINHNLQGLGLPLDGHRLSIKYPLRAYVVKVNQPFPKERPWILII